MSAEQSNEELRESLKQLKENKIQIQKISKLLLENLNVISVGVNRITQIVESAQKLS
jgi:EAL domain-containing protein (putative c-di-GMP-specific phosphodiesterase class I)